ncbi:MAG: peptidylprolyl isomerase [candidate division KSB1 bacterium]|nr:peptidylprolyl isomerase [candidate division KSB1 bacterium]MDZ7274346.1 peptidylprolyl isomerase [candidate division KSB1 bacterium]MDZ7284992.1 peptidylprolyl isomerase [candidate division KSB1 bacterium]MDZ7297587.1 peptidylprolyl isomerase [candidate division KSB1 bacterium]MDZ7308665.1 peptidylprolyl isomerase [candidate division KSB1 bacterium]
MFRPLTTPVVLLLLLIPHRGPAQEVLDRVVAVVDDKIILQSELSQYAYQLAIQLGIDPRREPAKFAQLQKNALASLVDQKVLLTKAQEDSVVVDERQVDQLLEDRIKNITQQLGSEQKVEEYFGQPMRKIRRTLRRDISEGLLVRNLQQQKYRNIKISRREVENFYHTMKDSLPAIKESVKLSHILMNIQPGEQALATAREKAEGLLKRIRAGENFAQLASQYSEDPGSSKRGGELGFIQRGDFVREFEETAFALQPGEISGLVQTQFGFHIIQMIDRRGEKINVRHLLIRVATSAGDEARTRDKAQTLREELATGKITFEEAAKQYSNDVTTNEKGGDLGWFEIDQLQVPEFVQVAKTLKPGEISPPLKTQFGYHLVRLDARREPRQFNLKEDWEQIEDMALNHKAEQEFRKWVEEYKKELYIKIADES